MKYEAYFKDNFHECHMKEVVAEVGSIRSSQRLWG